MIYVFIGCKQKMRTIVLLFLFFLLAGCEETYTKRQFNNVPEELKGCVFYTYHDDVGNKINIVRCPNSTTTVKTVGKNPVTTVTIDN